MHERNLVSEIALALHNLKFDSLVLTESNL